MIASSSIQVNQREHKELKVKCERCDGELLLLVHKNNQDHTCILGCGFCGHKNEIKLREVDHNE